MNKSTYPEKTVFGHCFDSFFLIKIIPQLMVYHVATWDTLIGISDHIGAYTSHLVEDLLDHYPEDFYVKKIF